MTDPVMAAFGTLALAGGYDVLKAVVFRAVSNGPSAIRAVRDAVTRDTGADVDDSRLEAVLSQPEVLDAFTGEVPTKHQWAALLRGVAKRGSGNSVRPEDLAVSIAGALNLLAEQELQGSEESGEAIESLSFAPSIRLRMAELRRTVEYLTDDQFRIIAQQRYRKVRISGVAGSGKTLVAMEKARRLEEAGFRTLFLCHNPGLAAHVADVLAGSTVDVLHFRRWIDLVNNQLAKNAHDSPWSPLDEPTSVELENAFDHLLANGTEYQAVIVDEGQDFRGEWWTVVEAAIEGSDLSALYIFHDDMQALVPHRAVYPPTDVTLSLTRNCRNSGEVYEAMRRLMTGIPPPDPLLEGSGLAHLVAFERGAANATLRAALLDMDLTADNVTVVVTGGSFQRSDLDPEDEGLVVEDLRWQWAVRRGLGLIARSDTPGFGQPLSDEVAMILRGLSERPWPSSEDASLIRKATKAVAARAGDQQNRQMIVQDLERAVAAALTGRSTPRRHGWSARSDPRVDVFGSEDWLSNLPRPRTVRLTDPRDEWTMDSIPVFTVAQFKGLEADNVLAIWDSASPEPLAELFVSVSRARSHLVCMIAAESMPVLPPRFRGDVDRAPLSGPTLGLTSHRVASDLTER